LASSHVTLGANGNALHGLDGELPAWLSGENGAYIEALFEDYLTGAAQVPAQWQEVFEEWLGRTRGPRPAAEPVVALGDERAPNTGIFGLVDAFRAHGHLIADLDPLEAPPESHPLLDPAQFGFSGPRLDQRMTAGHYRGLREATPRELVASLRQTYGGTFAVEFMEIRDKERRDWLIEQMEPRHNRPDLAREDRVRILREVLEAERFEQFLQRRFVGQKRFSLEGGEALIPMLSEIADQATELGASDLVLGMAHRGRLNVLTHLLGMPYEALFIEFQKGLVPMDASGSGDVKYHRGYSADRQSRSGRPIHLSLSPNPSHLEAINPVVEGMVRAKQNLLGDTQRSRVIPVLMHGDAAFNGQGVVTETLALSELEHYWTGGTIHIIVNNKIGFTTEPKDYCFTKYPSDMAKVIQAPVFHVNADDPEACVHAARLAIRFRQRFQEDVIIDLVCYRRHGHNEGDDPTYTQPVMYRKIHAHATVGTLHARRLLEQDVVDQSELDAMHAQHTARMERALEQSELRDYSLEGAESYRGRWQGHSGALAATTTSAPRETIERVGRALVEHPEGFHPHPKVQRLMEQRSAALLEDGPIDWGTGETLALGSLLHEGTTIRLSGQDVERGTFVHRHAVLYDVENGRRHLPLAAVGSDRAELIIGNSPLSEAAALGFEYGYSCVDPQRLVIWEAQFGDFANGAQIIIDQFISSAEQKWNRSSGLVMLLPHGYEGQGPEHSSARLERFLQLCAQDNLTVANLTTPAQLFHALRRQIHGAARKPLIVMSPKSLLRNALAVSRRDDFERGQFNEVIDDPARTGTRPSKVRRVLLCSGKLYYALSEARKEHAFDDVALIRVEQLHPFPFETLRTLLATYSTRDIVWVQEEPWNMGAWSYIQSRLSSVLPRGAKLRYVGRPEAASPATGSYRVHEQEEMELLREAFAPKPRPRAKTSRA
jgi:2-oxoglutarate dehydrogenase E1 component